MLSHDHTGRIGLFDQILTVVWLRLRISRLLVLCESHLTENDQA